MKVKLATRKSALARLQSTMVAAALRDSRSDLEIELVYIDSLGDTEPDKKLSTVVDRGYFTKLISQALTDGRADLAIHSWKDIPTDGDPQFSVIGTLPRADARDVILFRRDALKNISTAISILSSSPRRSYNLKDFLTRALPGNIQSVEFRDVRGNIETRITKLLRGDADGLVVAKAALDRLLGAQGEEFAPARQFISDALKNNLTYMVVPLRVCPPSAAQGAIAIEALAHRDDLKKIVGAISCSQSYEEALREKELLRSLGGGCEQAIGASVLIRPYGRIELVKGKTISGNTIDDAAIIRSSPLPKAASKDKIKIISSERSIERTDIPFNRSDIPKGSFIFCARHSAWPEDFAPDPDSVVWTAGLETWFALVKKGVFVHGSSESLGESEDPRINYLSPRLVKKIKFTNDAARPSGSYETIPTYHVSRNYKGSASDFASCTHFFWSSAEDFDGIKKIYPNITSHFHGCGPGRSYEHISNELTSGGMCAAYLNEDEFLKETLL